MKFDNNLKFLFTEFGVSGREENICTNIHTYIEKYSDEISVDVNGSLICKLNGTGKNKKKIMFAAHMDSIGFIVSHIDDNGFVRFSPVGGQSPSMILNKRVIFENGIIGAIAIEKSEYIKSNFTIAKMYIDIGASNKKEAENLVTIGDMCAIWNEPYVQNGKLFSAILDNRIGCYSLIKALEAIKNPYHDIYFAFTSQEEVGCRGATTATYKISPDYGFAIDITGSYDTPNCNIDSSIKLGLGTAVGIKDGGVIVPRQIVNYLTNICEKKKIKFQKEVLPWGANDARVMQTSKGGVLTGAISIATRHIHSANEVCDLGDVEETIKLIKEISADKEI